jgi:zinc/manganese transport system substrate-binding protein
MTSNTQRFALALAFATAALTATAPRALAAGKLSVVTTIPEFAWAASEIGGPLVETHALLNGTENPHFVDAVPEFTRLAAEADVVCVAGLDLEVGYMPPVLSRSGNAQVQPGGKGYCEVGHAVDVLEKPTGPVDRSMGDVHPSGNPHFWLSPKALSDGSREIAATLTRVDPSHGAEYQKGLEAFQAKLTKLSEDVTARLKPLLDLQSKSGGKPVLIEYHKEFSYFLAQYGLKSLGSIEEKPGVPPSAGRLGQVATDAKAAGIHVALAAEDNPKKTLDRFQELSGIPVDAVPTMIQGEGHFKTYSDLQLHIAETLVALATGAKLGN